VMDESVAIFVEGSHEVPDLKEVSDLFEIW
jgi:hypothetical protein